jgi:predicted secreted hydrolase
MGKAFRNILIVALVVTCGLAAAAAENSEGYLTVTGPCGLEFPRDHGAHPGFRTEWWYYTGNLQSDTGQPFGYQLTLFRSQIVPPIDEGAPAKPRSAWRTRQIYFGHAAVSDIAGRRHLQAEKVAREALGMAGAVPEREVTTIWLHDWSIQIAPDQHRLAAQTPDFGIDLQLTPVKRPVFHGDGGYSLKGSRPEQASCYYSYTRLESEGRLSLGGKNVPVGGTSWMDHEFSTAPLAPGIVGWDWFSLQLSDRTEVMVFLLRTESGGLHPASSGTFVGADGEQMHLEQRDVAVEVLDRWKSPGSGAVYPSRWRMQIAPLGIDLTIAARLADQEMKTTLSTGVTYWEGSVAVDGSANKAAVSGLGYAELTGYADPFEAPM